MNNELALKLVCNYINRMTPSEKDDQCTFEEKVTAGWAAEEILGEIADHPLKSAVDTIEAFSIRMEIFYYLSTKSCNKLRFQIARDTAEELGLLLI